MLDELCTKPGPRPAGSAELEKAARIVRGELAKALPVTGLDTLTFERWVLHGEPELQVGGTPVETFPGHGTSGTPPGGLTGIVKAHGKDGIPFAVIDGKTGGGIAYITVSTYGKAVPLPYYSFNQPVGCPPFFNIGRQDVPVIERAAADGVPVTLRAETAFIPDTPTSSAFGVLPGKTVDEILFIAHLDTVYNSPGANDNTASVIAMLMLAHAFSGTKPEKTLAFLATTGEEYGKLGALHYAERRKREGTFGNIRFVVNFDSLTWGPNIHAESEDGELRGIIAAIDRDLDLPGTPKLIEGDGFRLDAGPFRETRARALNINSRGYRLTHLWHRPEDTPETVPEDCVEIGFLMFREYIERLMSL